MRVAPVVTSSLDYVVGDSRRCSIRCRCRSTNSQLGLRSYSTTSYPIIILHLNCNLKGLVTVPPTERFHVKNQKKLGMYPRFDLDLLLLAINASSTSASVANLLCHQHLL